MIRILRRLYNWLRAKRFPGNAAIDRNVKDKPRNLEFAGGLGRLTA